MSTLDHIGISVGDLEAQASWYARAFGLTALPVTANPALGVRGCYLVHADEGWALELLERVGSRAGAQATDPTEALLTRGYGHVCLQVDDVDASFVRLLELDATAVRAPGPSPMSGLTIAFVADPEGNLIELIQRPRPLLNR